MCETQPTWTPHQVEAVTAVPCYQRFGKASFYKNKGTPNQPTAPLLIQSLQPIKEIDSPINWFHLQSNDTVTFEPIVWSWSSLWSVSNEAFSELCCIWHADILNSGWRQHCWNRYWPQLSAFPPLQRWLPSPQDSSATQDSASEPLQCTDQYIKANQYRCHFMLTHQAVTAEVQKLFISVERVTTFRTRRGGLVALLPSTMYHHPQSNSCI